MLWSARTETTLAAEEVLRVVTTNVVGNATAAEPLSEELEKSVSTARSILMRGLGDKPLRLCLSVKDNPFLMWSRLSDRYAVTNVVTKVQLQTRLSKLSYQGQTMSDFIDIFEEIFNRLDGMQSNIQEDMQVAMFLASFGNKFQSSYGQVIASLQTLGDALSWETVTSRMLQEYDERTWQVGTGITPKASGSGHALKVGNFERRNERAYGSGNASGSKRCFSCNEEGHFARNCPLNRRAGRRHIRRRPQQGPSFGSRADANKAELLLHCSGLVASQGSEFVIDSGASDHMVWDESMLAFKEKIHPRTIVLGNGSTLVAKRKGDVLVAGTLRPGRKSAANELMLRNVLYVPELKTNLISCSALCSDGHTVSFGRGGCSVMKDGSLVLQGIRDGGLYKTASTFTEMHSSDSYVNLASSVTEELWHDRLGHAHIESIRRLITSRAAVGLHLHKRGASIPSSPCESCIAGKTVKRVKTFNPIRATAVGEVVHSDVCGSMSNSSLGGSRYFTTFIDEFSGFIRVYAISQKSEVSAKFREYQAWLERTCDCNLKCLKSDGGGEYQVLKPYLLSKGIEWKVSPPYSPDQNGIAERANRTLVEATRAMLAHSGLTIEFWAEAVNQACDIRNRFFAPRHRDVTSYELFMNRKPRFDHYRVFGCTAWVFIPKVQRKKLDKKSEKGIVLYCSENSQYKVWLISSRKAITTRHLTIIETEFPGRQLYSDPVKASSSDTSNEVDDTSPSPSQDEPKGLREESSATRNMLNGTGHEGMQAEPAIDDIPVASTDPMSVEQDQEMLTYYPPNSGQVTEKDKADVDIHNDGPEEAVETLMEENEVLSKTGQHRYPQRSRASPNFYEAGSATIACSQTDPNDVAEALSQEDSKDWKDAIRSELKSLQEHGTWDVVPRPDSSRVIPTRFVFKRKLNEDGSVSRHKARLVVRGFMQGPVEDTYAPVVEFTSVRAAITVALQKGLTLHQLDIRTAFLHGEIDSTIFVSPPVGLSTMGVALCEKGEVLQLKKGLYGLKQAPKLWSEKWIDVMKILNFKPLRSDPCIFHRNGIWLLVYVDDIMVIAHRELDITNVIRDLKRHLDVKDLGGLRHFLGTSLIRNGRRAWLSQKQYLESILIRFGMQNCKPVNTPMCTDISISDNSPSVDQTLYQEMIGALLYLSTRTRPDVSAAVNILSRNTSDPRQEHLTAVKRVLRYLKGTIDFALKIGSSPSGLIAFADADWGGDNVDRKSTSGFVLQFADTSISWRTTKQKLVALSTAEAEFISASEACKELVWLRHLLQELNAEQLGSTVLFEDNQTAIHWATEGVRHAKHVAIRKNYLLEQVNTGIVNIKYCPSEYMTADIFTKPLLRKTFERLRSRLGVISMDHN